MISAASVIALFVLNGLKHEPTPSNLESLESVLVDTIDRNDNKTPDTVGGKTNSTNVDSDKILQPERSIPSTEIRRSNSQQVSTINIGYGKWQGPVKNGGPDGDGIVIITEACKVYGITVDVGYHMEATFENGVLVVGRIYDDNNNLVKTILP